MSSLEEIAKAKAKITKLLNMTVENGCSEDEQETAMAMAAAIATRLGHRPRSSASASKQRRHNVRASSAPSTRSSRFTRFLRSRQQPSCMGVKLFTYDTVRVGCSSSAARRISRLAEQTAFWLMRQVELLYKEHLPRGLSQSVEHSTARRSRPPVHTELGASLCSHARNEATATARRRLPQGRMRLVVQGYFQQLERENAAYFNLSEEQKARAEQRQLEYKRREEARRNAMTPAERDAEDKELERWSARRKSALAARRKGPRARSLPTGIGTNAGSQPATAFNYEGR
jgi:hypothetical protein